MAVIIGDYGGRSWERSRLSGGTGVTGGVSRAYRKDTAGGTRAARGEKEG